MKNKLTIVATALVAAVVAPGCLIVSDRHDDDGHYDDGYTDGGTDAAVYTTIDADHLLNTDLGEGAGLFVEYAAGGRWTLWTSCDTNITGSSCAWQANVFAQKGAISDVFEYDTEGFDSVDFYNDNALSFYAETTFESDAVEFYTDPGALVEIELSLDGYGASEYFVWFGNGDVNTGAFGSPVVFQPDQP